MKKITLGMVFGLASGVAASAFFINRFALPSLRKWCARIENKQIDNEIRLDILEYNHLHEDGHLRMLFEDLDELYEYD